MQINRTLIILDLNGSQICDEAAQLIGDALKVRRWHVHRSVNGLNIGELFVDQAQPPSEPVVWCSRRSSDS